MLSRFAIAVCLGSLVGVASAFAQDAGGIETATGLEKSLVAAIARAEKSVVAIARVRKERPGEAVNFEFRFDPFGRQTAPSVTPVPTDPDFVPTEYATGVVVDARGLVLTACHVLGDESDYYVTTHERKVYRATVKGADPRSDLAVLSISADHLIPITMGDAAALRKGSLVVALGNPYAIGRDGQVSASWGIVSNLARKAPPLPDDADSRANRTLHEFGTLIQTDARLNQGTSGGALVNLQGEMVGLTVALAAAAGYERGAGYAIPIDATFRRVIDTLKEGREVEYGFLGIRPANLKPQEILDGKHGIRVQSVVGGTPAERYGLKLDDVITAVGDRAIHGSDGLMLEVGRMPAGSLARFAVLRGGEPMRVEVALAKYPASGKKVVTSPRPAWRGLRVDYTTAMVDPDGARPAAFDDGVIVTEVVEGQPAAQAGLRPGMLITQVDRTPVHNPKQFRTAVSGKSGPVQIHLPGRDGQPESVRTVTPER